MKINKVLIMLLLAAQFGYGCKEETPPTLQPTNPWDTVTQYSGLIIPGNGTITFNIKHEYGGSPLEFVSKFYQNAAGDTFNIRELRHYLTNIELIKPNGDAVKLHNYHLIEGKTASTQTFTISGIPEGNYTKMALSLGVDAERNHSGLQEGALDPSWGMFWTWSTGYIFYRIYGLTASGTSYSFDVGGDNNLPIVVMDLKAFKTKSLNPKLNMVMEVSEMFKNPEVYSFKIDGYDIHSDNDANARKISVNMEDMVTVKSILP